MGSGNGNTKFEGGVADMGGWVRVFVGGGNPPPDLPIYLTQMLADWLRRHPQFVLRCVVPFNRHGETVELHAWYNVHLLPPTDIGPKAVPDR